MVKSKDSTPLDTALEVTKGKAGNGDAVTDVSTDEVSCCRTWGMGLTLWFLMALEGDLPR